MNNVSEQVTAANFSVPPVRNKNGFRATVVETRRLSDQLIRVTLTSPAVGETDFSPCTDRYVKLSFPNDGDPVKRSYTIRSFDTTAGTVDIDFVVHGDQGVAGPWAQAAQPGDELELGGVGGGYRPAPDAPWHLLIGDESALPAIAAALEAIPAERQVYAFLEIADDAQRIDLAHPDSVTWVPREVEGVSLPSGQGLAEQVLNFALPPEPGHVFLHGEANMVRVLRRHLRAHGYPMSAMSISGYWRDGSTDEMWRAQKSQWKQDVNLDEAALAPTD